MNQLSCLVFLFLLSSGCSYFSGATASALDQIQNNDQNKVESIPLGPTYRSIQANILDQKCTSCHSPGNPIARIPLNTYEDLINSPLDIVLPGNSAESGIFLVISTDDEDMIMPPPYFKGKPTGLLPLSVDEISAIKEWIDQGAQNN